MPEPIQPTWPACTTAGLDRRTRRTREALLHALLSLLREKPLSSISVTELTNMADVNRATFYTHYQDIFNMFDHLKQDICQTCMQMVELHTDEITGGEYGGILSEIYRFFDQNEDLFGVVFSDGADTSFSDSLLEVVREVCMRNAGIQQSVAKGIKSKGYSAAKAKQTSQTVCNYQFDYIAGGVVNILSNWMSSGRKESVEQMVAITNACIKSLNPDGTYSSSIKMALQFEEC